MMYYTDLEMWCSFVAMNVEESIVLNADVLDSPQQNRYDFNTFPNSEIEYTTYLIESFYYSGVTYVFVTSF